MPFPGLRQRLDLPGLRLEELGDGASTQMSIRIVNDDFTITSKRDGVQIEVKGSKAGGDKKVSEIKIKDGDTDVTVNSLDKVPEKHRDTVKKLLESIK
jgi:hypothetical protein